jgi:phosphoribosylglycinamide formyltransferase-1
VSAGGPLRVAVLASGNGTNLQALLDACRTGRVPAEVVLVASDRPEAFALERARRAGVAAAVLRRRDFPDRDAFDRALAGACADAGAGLVVLAGFLRVLGPAFLERWEGRCMNVHPSLLPAFPGLDAPAQALAYGVKVTGCTVHFVDRGVDTGPIILQEAVPVLPDDDAATLHRRIQQAEWRLLPEAVRLYAEGRLRVEGRRVRILGAEGEGGVPTCPGR